MVSASVAGLATAGALDLTLSLYPVPPTKGNLADRMFVPVVSKSVPGKFPSDSDNSSWKTLFASKVPVVLISTEIEVPAQAGKSLADVIVIVACPKEVATPKIVARIVRILFLINVFFMYLSKYLSANLFDW
jgi:hypothetical protein